MQNIIIVFVIYNIGQGANALGRLFNNGVMLYFLKRNGGLKMKIEEMSVLVCDDSMFARKSMCMFIATLGIKNIYEASDGQEAIEKYTANKPDVVFMDIVMPVVTGIDALIKIKESDPDATVVMASSIGTQNHLKAAIKAGAADFLQKPISNDQVKQILENVAKGVL